jgi:serine/threonine protein kinase
VTKVDQVGAEPIDELRIHAPAMASGTSLPDRAPELLALRHPSLARVDQAGTQGGSHFLAQAHLDGRWLGAGLTRWTDVQAGLEGLLDGLGLLHRTIGAHGAVGPRTLQLTEDGRLVLLDIGLGNLFEPVLDPRYSMPGEPQTPAHDLYALGAWLHEVWSGQPPFASPDLHVLRQLHRQAEPPPLADAPALLTELVKWLLAKRPEQRPSVEDALLFARFLPTPDPPKRQPELEQLGGNRLRWPLAQDSYIGRAVTNEICVTDSMMGRRHARFVWREGALWIEDLGSANGLFLNDLKTDRAILKDGDKLRLGTGTYVVHLPGSPQSTEKSAKK